jgi:hypothetical protein
MLLCSAPFFEKGPNSRQHRWMFGRDNIGIYALFRFTVNLFILWGSSAYRIRT